MFMHSKTHCKSRITILGYNHSQQLIQLVQIVQELIIVLQDVPDTPGVGDGGCQLGSDSRVLCVEGQGLLRSETNVSPKGTLPQTVMELKMENTFRPQTLKLMIATRDK